MQHWVISNITYYRKKSIMDLSPLSSPEVLAARAARDAAYENGRRFIDAGNKISEEISNLESKFWVSHLDSLDLDDPETLLLFSDAVYNGRGEDAQPLGDKLKAWGGALDPHISWNHNWKGDMSNSMTPILTISMKCPAQETPEGYDKLAKAIVAYNNVLVQLDENYEFSILENSLSRYQSYQLSIDEEDGSAFVNGRTSTVREAVEFLALYHPYCSCGNKHHNDHEDN
jgi:hypothetical protein